MTIAEWVQIKKTTLYNYYHKRDHCPQCKSVNNTTYHYWIDPNYGDPDIYKDTNEVVCENCGWKGIVHELAHSETV